MSEPKKPKKTVLQRVIGFFVNVYLWVKDTLTDDQARAALVTDLGLPADEAPPKLDIPKEKLDSLQRYRSATDVDTAAFMLRSGRADSLPRTGLFRADFDCWPSSPSKALK